MKIKKAIACLLVVNLMCFTGCKNNGSSESEIESDEFYTPVRDSAALTDYSTLGLANYKEQYINSPFFSNLTDNVTYAANAMWSKFGLVNDGTDAVIKIGGNSAWFYWDTIKFMWAAGEEQEDVKTVIQTWPVTSDGYVWSWLDSEYWGGKGYNDEDPTYTKVYHLDNNFNYINAVYECLAWDNGTDFLNKVDYTDNEDADFDDASGGLTVLQKTELAYSYILNGLNGKNGLIIIDDGRCTGEFHSSSANYWDNLCFGYKDAYEGMLFLGVLKSMQGIYTMSGNSEKAETCSNLLFKAKTDYDATYWNSEKGRYICTVSKSGKVMDYGLTFLNTEALYYGAGNQSKANKIYSWIDGERVVEGDTLTGLGILDNFKISPVVNTVAVESIKEYNETDRKYYNWWHAPQAINPYTNAKYGQHCENGGTIFYTAFFENMSRIKYGKTESALQRFITIADEYGKDELMRDPKNDFAQEWVVGVIGEFPESGLVPLVYVKGFMGVNATCSGLEIKPNIPTEYDTMGCKKIRYGKKNFTITENRGKSIILESADNSSEEINLIFSDFKGGEYTVKVTDENGQTILYNAVKNAEGTLSVKLTASAGCKIEID